MANVQSVDTGQHAPVGIAKLTLKMPQSRPSVIAVTALSLQDQQTALVPPSAATSMIAQTSSCSPLHPAETTALVAGNFLQRASVIVKKPAAGSPGNIPVIASQPASAAAIPVEAQKISSRAIWTSAAVQAMADADNMFLPYRNMKLAHSEMVEITAKGEEICKTLRDAFLHCDPHLQTKINGYRHVIREMYVSLEEQLYMTECERILETGKTANTLRGSSCTPASSQQNPALTALEMSISSNLNMITYNLDPDVANLSPQALMEATEKNVPVVLRTVHELHTLTAEYEALAGADLQLISLSESQCKQAYTWTQHVITAYCGMQCHILQNSAQNSGFIKFDPAGDISIYEFLANYEKRAQGCISENALAYILYSRFLPATLTESCQEPQLGVDDYQALKSWLIDQFGNVAGVAEKKLLKLSVVKPVSSSGNLLGQAQYLRDIHKSVTILHGLEISKGVRVPGMQEHLVSNSFLTKLMMLTPDSIQEEWCHHLAHQKTSKNKAEGLIHLNSLLQLVHKEYLALESQFRVMGRKPTPKAKPCYEAVKKPVPEHKEANDSFSTKPSIAAVSLDLLAAEEAAAEEIDQSAHDSAAASPAQPPKEVMVWPSWRKEVSCYFQWLQDYSTFAVVSCTVSANVPSGKTLLVSSPVSSLSRTMFQFLFLVHFREQGPHPETAKEKVVNRRCHCWPAPVSELPGAVDVRA